MHQILWCQLSLISSVGQDWDTLGLVDLRRQHGHWADPDSYDFDFLLASYFIAEPESGCPEFITSDQEIYGKNSAELKLFEMLALNMVWFGCLDQVVWLQFPWTKARTCCDSLGLVGLRGRRGQTLNLAQGALDH